MRSYLDYDSDLILTGRAATGDPTAAKALICRVMSRVHHTCGYLANGNEGADLAQMALMEVIRSAGSFRGESTLEYWVDRVTVQTSAKVFTKRARQKRLRDAIWAPGPDPLDVERQAELGQVRRQLQHHLLKISEKQRMVVVLHYLYDYEVPEMADLLNIKINSVRSRLREGLRRLRRSILTDPCLREWIRKGKR